MKRLSLVPFLLAVVMAQPILAAQYGFTKAEGVLVLVGGQPQVVVAIEMVVTDPVVEPQFSGAVDAEFACGRSLQRTVGPIFVHRVVGIIALNTKFSTTLRPDGLYELKTSVVLNSPQPVYRFCSYPARVEFRNLLVVDDHSGDDQVITGGPFVWQHQNYANRRVIPVHRSANEGEIKEFVSNAK